MIGRRAGGSSVRFEIREAPQNLTEEYVAMNIYIGDVMVDDK